MKVAAFKAVVSGLGDLKKGELLFEYELDGLKPIPAVGDYVNCGVNTENNTLRVHTREFHLLEDTIEIYLVN